MLTSLEIPVVRVSVMREIATAYIDRDDASSAQAMLRDALLTTERIRDFEQRRLCFLDLGVLMQNAGDRVGGREAFMKAGRMSREQGGLRQQAQTLREVIRTQAFLGDFEGALALASQHEDIVGSRHAAELVTEQMLRKLAPLARPGSFDIAVAMVEGIDHWLPRITGLAAVASARYRAAKMAAEEEADDTSIGTSSAIGDPAAMESQANLMFSKLLNQEVPALRRPSQRLDAYRTVAMQMARCGHPDAKAQLIACMDLAASIKDRPELPGFLKESVQLIALSADLGLAESVAEGLENPLVQALTYALVGEKRALRGELTRATLMMRRSSDAGAVIRNAEDQDAIMLVVTKGFEQIGINQMRENQVREGRSAFEAAIESASLLNEPQRRDQRLSELTRAIVATKDYTTARKAAEAIEDAEVKRSAEAMIDRASAAG